ncbi:MAG: hypothetical protein GWN86_06940 [Desulfobacterales bacterium]|nr:hypothetical protein [Desulfobacterales bacterium]
MTQAIRAGASITRCWTLVAIISLLTCLPVKSGAPIAGGQKLNIRKSQKFRWVTTLKTGVDVVLVSATHSQQRNGESPLAIIR